MHIEQQQVGLEARDLLVGLRGSAGAAEQLIFAVAQQHFQSGTDHRVIVDKQDSSHAAAPARGRLMRMLVDPGSETKRREPWARSTRSLRDHGSTWLPALENPEPLSATLS